MQKTKKSGSIVAVSGSLLKPESMVTWKMLTFFLVWSLKSLAISLKKILGKKRSIKVNVAIKSFNLKEMNNFRSVFQEFTFPC